LADVARELPFITVNIPEDAGNDRLVIMLWCGKSHLKSVIYTVKQLLLKLMGQKH